MDINFTLNNVSCNGLSDGSISIDSVDLTPPEQITYGSNFTIDWSDNIDTNNISDNNLIASSLSANTYGFRIFGNSNYSDWTYVNITEPDILDVAKITKYNNPCDSNASVVVDISGGTPPYSVIYDTLLVTGSGNQLIFSGLNINYDNVIRVVDSRGCSSETDSTVSIVFSSPSIDFVSQSPPLIYDDHPESFIFTVTGYGPFKINIWESLNGIKSSIINSIEFFDTTYITSIVDNVYTYNIASLIYPGNYIFDIFDSNNCYITTETVQIQNSVPLSVNVVATNNNPINNSFVIPISPILDTLLIPFNMIVNNSTILDFIKSINLQDKILLKVNNIDYLQTIIKFNKNKSNYNNNQIDILQLGPTPDLWFFSIQITKGFDYTTIPEILIENVVLSFNNTEIPVEPFFNNESNTIKLLRGSLLTSAFNTAQFNVNKKVGIYKLENNEFALLQEAIASYIYNFFNTYIAGSIFCINILDNSLLNTIFDIYNVPNFTFSIQQLEYQKKLKSIINFLNNYNLDIYIAATENIENNGTISMNIIGGYPQDDTYNISYHYWNSQQLQNIFLNNQLLTSPKISFLQHGVYVVKVSDQYNNKIKILNGINYDNHYSESLDYINNVIDASKELLNFQYGDLLIPIDLVTVNNTSNFTSIIPGTPAPPPQPSGTTIILNPDIIDIYVTNNNTYNNSISINISPTNINCLITGPNGYSRVFSNKTRFINLPPGVYNINGDNVQLMTNYLINNSFKIYVTNNLQENINIVFNSYFNKPIIGN